MVQASFNLRSCSSNCYSLQKAAAKDQTVDATPTVNILGMCWNTTIDILLLAPKKLSPSNMTFVTKWDVLQISSQLYDLLGYAAPVTIKVKTLLQEISLSKVSWDESDAIRYKWLIIFNDIQKLPMTVPRTYSPSSNPSTDIYSIYVLSGASIKAYGAVGYIYKNKHIS